MKKGGGGCGSGLRCAARYGFPSKGKQGRGKGLQAQQHRRTEILPPGSACTPLGEDAFGWMLLGWDFHWMMRNEARGRILLPQIPQREPKIWRFPLKTSKFGSIHVNIHAPFKRPLIPRSRRVHNNHKGVGIPSSPPHWRAQRAGGGGKSRATAAPHANPVRRAQGPSMQVMQGAQGLLLLPSQGASQGKGRGSTVCAGAWCMGGCSCRKGGEV